MDELLRNRLSDIARNVSQRILETWREPTLGSTTASECSTELSYTTESTGGSSCSGDHSIHSKLAIAPGYEIAAGYDGDEEHYLIPELCTDDQRTPTLPAVQGRDFLLCGFDRRAYNLHEEDQLPRFFGSGLDLTFADGSESHDPGSGSYVASHALDHGLSTRMRSTEQTDVFYDVDG